MMEIYNEYDNKEDSETYVDSCAPSQNSSSERKSSGSDLSDDRKYDSVNGLPPSEIQHKQENKKYVKKIRKIRSVLLQKPLNVEKLRHLAVSKGGLVNDTIRKEAWLQLLGLTVVKVPEFSEEELENHPEYQQVVVDVNRCLSRFPPSMPHEQRLAFQNQLKFLILRVITAHPRLRYYQGYHDVAITLLLVTGLDAAYLILEKLSTHYFKDCMESTMEKTSHLLNYIYPLVRHQNKEVYEYLEKSGVGNVFALPWFITWFSHSLKKHEDVVRLFDYFLASEPLAPLYLSAVIIEFRSEEILKTPCDMANLHSLLSQIPDLPLEDLLEKTTKLYKKYPVESIQKEALARTRFEEEQRKKEYALRMYRMNQNLPFLWRMVDHIDPNRRLPIWAFIHPNRVRHNFSHYRYIVATATFAFGLYAVYLKTVEATQMPEKR